MLRPRSMPDYPTHKATDDSDLISARSLALARYRRNHEFMNEVFMYAAFGMSTFLEPLHWFAPHHPSLGQASGIHCPKDRHRIPSSSSQSWTRKWYVGFYICPD